MGEVQKKLVPPGGQLAGRGAGDDTRTAAGELAGWPGIGQALLITPTGGRCTCGAQVLKEWSSSKELAAWLGIEVTSLYWLASTGQSPRRYRIGKESKYRRGDVEEWILTRVVD
jgi:predicted DNA-binding transcriptional regulator AlpA